MRNGVEQQIEGLEAALSGLGAGLRRGVLIAVADLMDAALLEPDPLGAERRPDAGWVPAVREIEQVIARLRESAVSNL